MMVIARPLISCEGVASALRSLRRSARAYPTRAEIPSASVHLSALWAVAYFVSAAIGRPLIGIFANAWYPFPRWFRETTPYRREFGLQSVVWGVYCLARAVLRLIVLLHSGIGGFLLVSVVTGMPFFVALVAWGIWHARRSFGRLDVAVAAD